MYLASQAVKWAAVVAFMVAACRADQLHAQQTGSGLITPQTEIEFSDTPPMTEAEMGYPPTEPLHWGASLPADCGMGCPPTWRVRGEFLYFNREGDVGFTHSTASRLEDFDYEDGYRLTIGRKYDCTVGWEVTYMGPFEWIEQDTVIGAGNLDSNFISGGGLDVSAFDAADVHQQFYRSELQSVEASQKWWGWDVITTSLGVRYLIVQEDYSFLSVDDNGDLGLLEIDTNNHLIGPQIGLELLYPIGNWSLDGLLKGAIYANFADGNNRLTNAGVVQFDHSPEDVEFGASVEGGTFLRRAITPRVIARVGYEFLWIYGLGTVPRQVENPITFTTGASYDGHGDTFYHGASAGLEIIW